MLASFVLEFVFLCDAIGKALLGGLCCVAVSHAGRLRSSSLAIVPIRHLDGDQYPLRAIAVGRWALAAS